jgi:predicted  nucleic acid-binding Zn-ribbon protein
VSAEELERLLVVQEHDLALDRLRHRRETLTERSELETRNVEAARTDAARAELAQRRDGVLAEERKLDDEAQRVGAHAADVEQRLYSGTVTSPRELQAMQADVDMLRRQRSDLEDRELELMEAREALDREVTETDTALEALATEIAGLETAIASAEAEIDAEIATETAARAEAASGVSDGLLRDYEQRRARNRGAGAARLVGTTCQACHLSIPSTEAERIRRGAGDVVASCDNCGAILVP